MIRKYRLPELTKKQVKGVINLIEKCLSYEKLELNVPDLADPDGLALMYFESPKSPEPASVLLAFSLGEAWEVTAFTDPAKRCRGYFTSLLEKFADETDGAPLCFYADGYSYDALKTLEVIDAEYTGTEHVMSLQAPLSDNDKEKEGADGDSTVTFSPATMDQLEVLCGIHSRSFDCSEEDSKAFLMQILGSDDTSLAPENEERQRLFTICRGDGEIVGLYAISEGEHGSALFCFCIDEPHRGKGLATAALDLLLRSSDLVYPVTLHVSEENEPAFRLYRKAGFISEQELMEYWF